MNFNQHTEDIAQELRNVLPNIIWQINPTGGGRSAIQGLYYADGILIHIVESEDGAQAPLSWLDSVTVTFKEYNYGESHPIGSYDNCADMIQRIVYDIDHESRQLTCSDCGLMMRACVLHSQEVTEYRERLNKIRQILTSIGHPDLVAILDIIEDGYLTNTIPTCNENSRG